MRGEGRVVAWAKRRMTVNKSVASKDNKRDKQQCPKKKDC